jgi:hypothetical protein
MDRVRSGGYSALIEAAYQLIPPGLHQFIRPHFLCGTDPVFAGLHRYENVEDDRPYKTTVHVAYDFHQDGLRRALRHTTVVLPREPKLITLATMVHELGHVLDEALRFEHDAHPINDWANTNRYEAFAEAFTAWVLPFGHGYGADKDQLYDSDRQTVALFEELATPGRSDPR